MDMVQSGSKSKGGTSRQKESRCKEHRRHGTSCNMIIVQHVGHYTQDQPLPKAQSLPINTQNLPVVQFSFPVLSRTASLLRIHVRSGHLWSMHSSLSVRGSIRQSSGAKPTTPQRSHSSSNPQTKHPQQNASPCFFFRPNKTKTSSTTTIHQPRIHASHHWNHSPRAPPPPNPPCRSVAHGEEHGRSRCTTADQRGLEDRIGSPHRRKARHR